MSKAREQKKDRVAKILEVLHAHYGDAQCALDYDNPYQLLVATVLSAQCTDVRVNQVTPALFERFPDPQRLAVADVTEVEELIRSTGFYRNKAKNLVACARQLVEEHDASVPSDLASLVALPGVGRKTANVVRGNAFGIPGMVVDTHVKRLSRRFGWTLEQDPVKIEAQLCRLIPEEDWTQVGHEMIAHGRALCRAPVPICSRCFVAPHCPRVGVDRAR